LKIRNKERKDLGKIISGEGERKEVGGRRKEEGGSRK